MYGINDKRLIEKELPYIAIPFWNTFWQLHETRQITAAGTFQPITFQEIEAYSRLMQVDFEPYEVDIVKRMDRSFITKLNTTKDKQ